MHKYLHLAGKWLLLFWAVSAISFFIVRLTPGSPVDIELERLGLAKTAANIAIMEERFHLDKALWQQYLIWLKDFFSGEWGRSYLTQAPLTEDILARLPLSFGIGCGGIVLAMLLGFFIGYKAALQGGGIYDHLSRALTLLGQTVPVFLPILAIIYFLGVKFQLLHFFFAVTAEAVLLAITFIALPLVGPMSRVVKVHFEETSRKTFMQYYEYRGYDKRRALFRYGSREALYGLCAVAVSKFSLVVGGAAVVEFSLALPGVSTFLIESIARRDYPLVQTYIMLLVIWMFFVNLFFELVMDGLIKREE